MKKDDKNHLIYESKRQPALYFISIITVALSIFVFYMIFSDWEEFALEYSSEFSAVAWTGYMLVAGNAMLVCMLWMNGRYILQIKKADENYIFIKTWSILGFHKTRKYPADIFLSTVFYNGISNYLYNSVIVTPFSVFIYTIDHKLFIDAT